MSATTGATPEQIEAAALRIHTIRKESRKIPHGDWPCAQCCGQADAWAPCFVDSDHRIVPNDADHLSESTAEAMRQVWDFADECEKLVLIEWSTDIRAALARLKPLLGATS